MFDPLLEFCTAKDRPKITGKIMKIRRDALAKGLPVCFNVDFIDFLIYIIYLSTVSLS